MDAFADPIKQEIWATVRAMNDTWTKGNPDELALFFHRDMLAITPTERHRLNDGAECIAGWKGFCEANRIHRWEEIDPDIRVYGDSAVVAYDYDMSFDRDGRTVESRGRDMLFFVREGSRWLAVADQFSSYPK